MKPGLGSGLGSVVGNAHGTCQRASPTRCWKRGHKTSRYQSGPTSSKPVPGSEIRTLKRSAVLEVRVFARAPLLDLKAEPCMPIGKNYGREQYCSDCR